MNQEEENVKLRKNKLTRPMQLANIRVRNFENNKHSGFKKNRNSSSLKNLKNVKVQIEKQKRIKKKLQNASETSKDARVSLQIELEMKKAFDKLRGTKVHDDLILLKKAEKRLLRKKKKSTELWAGKKEELAKSLKERQEKRKENIEKYRGKRKQTEVASPAAVGVEKSNKLSRKQRRHQNLLKFGPKKTRADREEKKKEKRKEMKKTLRSKKRN
jgi:hypothetical protein